MRTRPLHVVFWFALLGSAQAFEPGSERICTPTADGKSFECRDKGADPDKATRPAESEPTAPLPATATAAAAEVDPPTTSAAATTTASPAATRLPNYLMQSPGTTPPASGTAAAEPARPVQAAAPTREIPPASAVDAPLDAPARAESRPAAKAPAPAPQPDIDAPSRAAADEVAEPIVAASQPAPAAQRQPDSAPAPGQPARPAVEADAASQDAASSVPTARRSPAGADAFGRLPASSYTLVLASARNPAELDALIPALDALSGQLYLLRLNMPDGEWYSLCWSDFIDLDAARAARAGLPVDAAITSGWPRRIGLLQNELAR